MHYLDFGLENTAHLLARAMKNGYAVPAFNFYNMETMMAILDAAQITHSPIILAVSESALAYMGDDVLMGMIAGAKYHKGGVALHLDHGHSFEICKRAIDMGFSSVMFDGSQLPLPQNIKTSRRVADYAHKHDVSVETELGVLAGFEDENTSTCAHTFTNPDIVCDFVQQTKTDSLAVAIGTSHGAYKRENKNESLRFDILKQIMENIPKTPLVLHGASTIPGQYIKNINKHGGQIVNAYGIPPTQIRRAIKMHIAKVNIDSDLRLAATSGIREYLDKNASNFNPRDYFTAAKDNITKTCISEIQNIMGSGYKI